MKKLEGLTVSAILLILASFLQVGNLDLEPTYFCNSDKELTAFCYTLSGSGITCYTQPDRTGGKRCSGGQWQEFPPKPSETPVDTLSPETGSKRIHCNKDGCS